MSEVKTVKTTAIAERRVEWAPKGWDQWSRKVAIIRDGKVDLFPSIDGRFVEANSDGCVEFIQAVKQAMAETKKD